MTERSDIAVPSLVVDRPVLPARTHIGLRSGERRQLHAGPIFGRYIDMVADGPGTLPEIVALVRARN